MSITLGALIQILLDLFPKDVIEITNSLRSGTKLIEISSGPNMGKMYIDVNRNLAYGIHEGWEEKINTKKKEIKELTLMV